MPYINLKKDKEIPFILDESSELSPFQEYPFRASLIKVARCGTCKNTKSVNCGPDGDLVVKCKKGKDLVYPLLVHEHNCEFYEYKHHSISIISPNIIITFVGAIKRLDECNKCANNLYGHCDGLKIYPFEIKDGICEYFRDKEIICKHAVPCFQYGSTLRNNYCKLNPDLRDGDSNRGWKWHCGNAHKKGAERLKCYIPKGKTEEAIRILYRKSYEEKWKEIEEGRNYLRYEPCAFCESVGSMNILGINNPKCSENCGIDSSICGSPNSLLAQLVNYHDESGLEFKEITNKIIIEIKKRGGIQS